MQINPQTLEQIICQTIYWLKFKKDFEIVTGVDVCITNQHLLGSFKIILGGSRLMGYNARVPKRFKQTINPRRANKYFPFYLNH